MDLFHQRKKKKTNLDKHKFVTCIRSQKMYIESNLHVFNSKTLRQMQECEFRYFINILIVLLYFKAFKHILYLLQFWASQMWNVKFDAFVSTFLPLVFFEVYLYPPGVLTGNMYHKSKTMSHAQNMCRPLSWWNILTRKDE